jgi:tetratricopeptide (TPR) repeat protein
MKGRAWAGLGPFSGAILLVAGLSSCSVAGDFASLLRANSLHRTGRYEEASALYLSLRRPPWRAVIDFDLANAWARLGEEKAASSLYATSRRAGDRGLKEAAWYNEGILHYEEGRYEEAWRAFREALVLDPRDEDARRNLELAWRDWQKASLVEPPGLAPVSRKEGGLAEEDLRILRRLETGSWRPGGAGPGTGSGADY